MYHKKLILLSIVIFGIIVTPYGVSQKTAAEVTNIEYPRQIAEDTVFNVTATIRNLSYENKTFFVRLLRRDFLSMQEDISIPGNESGQLTFQLKLLLSGSLKIEVGHDSQIDDSAEISFKVIAPASDVGLLVIQMTEAEVTIIGVSFAAMAIAASLYFRMKQTSTIATRRHLESVDKLRGKGNKKRRKTLDCIAFLFEESYDRCLYYLLKSSYVKELLSGKADMKSALEIRSNLDNVKSSIQVIVGMLVASLFFGVAFISLAPLIVDAVWFLYPEISARDLTLFGFYLPMISIIMYGVDGFVVFSFLEEMGGKSLLLLAAPQIIFAVFFFFSGGFLGALIILVIANAPIVIAYLILRERYKFRFRKELTEVERLRRDLQIMRKKSIAGFEKEKGCLLSDISDKLTHFETAAVLIDEYASAELRNLDAKHSYGVIGDREYARSKNRLGFLRMSCGKLISAIPREEETAG